MGETSPAGPPWASGVGEPAAARTRRDHRRAFATLTSGRFDNFCLVSCFIDDEATAEDDDAGAFDCICTD